MFAPIADADFTGGFNFLVLDKILDEIGVGACLAVLIVWNWNVNMYSNSVALTSEVCP
jgi:hypothetical protein